MGNKKIITPDTIAINNLIAKVAKLAERGVDGEKQSAINKLNQLCLKYGIEYVGLDELESKVRTFKYSTFESKTILAHCIWDAIPDVDIQGDSSIKSLFVICTLSQFVEIKERYKHYYKIYKEECKTFMTAFILKNNIGVKIDNENTETKSKEDVVKLNVMMNLIQESPYEKTRNIELE